MIFILPPFTPYFGGELYKSSRLFTLLAEVDFRSSTIWDNDIELLRPLIIMFVAGTPMILTLSPSFTNPGISPKISNAVFTGLAMIKLGTSKDKASSVTVTKGRSEVT